MKRLFGNPLGAWLAAHTRNASVQTALTSSSTFSVSVGVRDRLSARGLHTSAAALLPLSENLEAPGSALPFGAAAGVAGSSRGAAAVPPSPTGVVDDGSEASARLGSMLHANDAFVERKDFRLYNMDVTKRGFKGSSRCVVVTCMDTRLTTLLPAALSIKPGDAKIIKNAGAIVSHPFGGIMRSVIVALYELKADEGEKRREAKGWEERRRSRGDAAMQHTLEMTSRGRDSAHPNPAREPHP
jgi:hypothetical protein